MWPIIVFWAGCSSPPDAPEGIDATAPYLLRHFRDDDPVLQAGLEGLMAWYEAEGRALVEEEGASAGYQLADLRPEDVEHLALDDEILIHVEREEYAPRDVNATGGIVTVAEMDCPWTESMRWLLHPDQHRVFPDEWTDYDRRFLGSPQRFQEAARGQEEPRLRGVNPYDEGFAPEDHDRAYLVTRNTVDPAPAYLGLARIGEFELHLEARQLRFEWAGETLGVFAILSYVPGAAWGDNGVNALLQTYSLEVNVARPGDRTLRALAVWSEPFSTMLPLDPESPLAIREAIRKARLSSDRLAEVCEGRVSIEP